MKYKYKKCKGRNLEEIWEMLLTCSVVSQTGILNIIGALSKKYKRNTKEIQDIWNTNTRNAKGEIWKKSERCYWPAVWSARQEYWTLLEHWASAPQDVCSYPQWIIHFSRVNQSIFDISWIWHITPESVFLLSTSSESIIA